MTQPHENDPRELLGGYATGTLSEEEKARLFQAALEDQELFNALADEEALRELLSDPRARQRLLEALGQPRIVPLWRRPAMLSAAAGLLVVITSTLLFHRQPRILEEERTQRRSGQAQPQSAPEAPGPAASAPKAPMKVNPAPSSSPAPDAERARSKEGESPIPFNLVGGVAKAEKKQDLPGEDLYMPDSASAPSGSVAPPPPAPAATPSVSHELMEVQTSLVVGSARPAADQASRPKGKGLSKSTRGESAIGVPAHLEPLGEGRFRLWIQPRAPHLYVLQREGASIQVLKPSPMEGSERRYEFSGAGVLDIYELMEEAPEPERLPASGPVPGQRYRIPIPK